MNSPLGDMVEAARRGGEYLVKHFGQKLAITEKSMAADVVTQADHDSEKVIIEILSQKFPTYNILSEEAGLLDRKSDSMFIVDPLDGSHNFVIGLPNFTVSITLTYKGETVASVVHQPLLNQTYWVERGGGFLHDGLAAHTNQESEIKRATITHIRNYIAPAERNSALFQALLGRGVKRYLSNWSPAWDFCLLASGKIEAMIADITTQQEAYDYVGGKLMVREAGGKVTDFLGNDDASTLNGQFIASNGTVLHDELVKILKSCGYT